MLRRIVLILLVAVAGWACNLKDDGGTSPDAGADGGVCSPEQSTTCDGDCVDTQTNVEHCGSCGESCLDSPDYAECVEPTCVDGACAFEPLSTGSCTLDDGTQGVCVQGACAECTVDSECVDPPTSHSECWAATCTDENVCDYSVPDPQTPCGGATCEDGTLREPDLCGELGSCNLRDPGTDCAPYVCNSAGDACTDSCEQDADCAPNTTCFTGECLDRLPVDILIGSDQQNVIVSEKLVEVYEWDGSIPVEGTITISANATVGSTSNAEPALLVDPLTAESTLTIINEGMILGAGGKGGDALARNSGEPDGYNEPTDGGVALEVESHSPDTLIRIDNRGLIGGGGGGGAAGITYIPSFNFSVGVAGGGGAGYAVGPRGTADDSFQYHGDGKDGTRETGGAEGRYEGIGGGRGGDLGQRGGRVDDAQNSSSRGDAGPAIVGASHFEWVTRGDVQGTELR
jgi:hypothetical protein